MYADPLYAALDDALEHPDPRDLTRSDRLVGVLWWLIESMADEFEIPFEEEAADDVAMLCGLARETTKETLLPETDQNPSG